MFAVFAIVGLPLGAVSLPLGAVGHSAPLDTVVTGLRTVDRAAPGEAFRIDFDWQLPDDAAADEEFLLDLPDALRPLEPSFDVTDPHGEVIAHAVATDDGVGFTLTDYVGAHANVSGSVHFGVEMVEDAPPGDSAVIGWGGARTTEIVIAPADEAWTNDRHKGQKHGEYYPATGTIEWIVMGPLGYESVTFDDTAQDGQLFQCEQMRVEIWNLDVGGHWESSVLAGDHDVTCDEGRVKGTIRGVPRGKIGALIIPTGVPPDVTEVENTATVSVDGRTDLPTATSVVTSSGGSGEGDAAGEGAGDGADAPGDEGLGDGELGDAGVQEDETQADEVRGRLWPHTPLAVGLGLLALLAALIAVVMVRRRR